MTTNFFNQIARLDLTGVLQITISKGAENKLVVSTMVSNEQCGDKAKHLIIPLILKGTAAELDEEYFEQISTPIQIASGTMSNMEAYLKQIEEAKKSSAMQKDKAEKGKKETQDKDKKYTESMQKVTDLEKAGKFREALSKVPDPSLYPEHAEAIRKIKDKLSAKLSPSIFETLGSPEEEQIQDNESDKEDSDEDDPEDEMEYYPEEN